MHGAAMIIWPGMFIVLVIHKKHLWLEGLMY